MTLPRIDLGRIARPRDAAGRRRWSHVNEGGEPREKESRPRPSFGAMCAMWAVHESALMLVNVALWNVDGLDRPSRGPNRLK